MRTLAVLALLVTGGRVQLDGRTRGPVVRGDRLRWKRSATPPFEGERRGAVE